MPRVDIGFENFDSTLSGVTSPLLIGFFGEGEPEDNALKISEACGGYVGAVRVESEPELSAALEIRTTPTYILISGGRVIRRTTGQLDGDAADAFLH